MARTKHVEVAQADGVEPIATGKNVSIHLIYIFCEGVGAEWLADHALHLGQVGVRQHVEASVRPWLIAHAPWALGQPGMLRGCYDPSGETGEETDIDAARETVRAALGLSGGSDAVGRLYAAVRAGEGQIVVRAADGSAYASLFGRFRVQDNPFWRAG